MGQLVFIPYSSAGSAPTPSGVFDIYLSGRNGSDANDGLTPATAKATPAGVWELFPAGLSGPLVVHCGAAGVVGDDVAYDWTTMPVPQQLNDTARIWIYGDGAGQAGEDGFEVIVTGAAAAGTDANQITLAVPVVADVYQHYTLEITSGPAIGYRRTIQSNTTTSIVPCRRYENQAGTAGAGTTPVNGDTFRIVRPSVIFDDIDELTGQPGFLSNIGGGDGASPLFLVNVAFAATSSSVEINNCTLYMAGVEFRGTTFPSLVNCSGSIGWWDQLNAGTIASRPIIFLPSSTAINTAKSQWFTDIGMTASLTHLAEWRGWGASSPDIVAVTAEFFSLFGCSMSGIGTWARVKAAGACNVSWGGYFWGGLAVQGNSFLGVLPQNVTAGTNGVVFRGAISVIETSNFNCYAPIVVLLTAAGTGITVGFNSYANIGGGTVTTVGLGIDVFDFSVVETVGSLAIVSSTVGLRVFNNGTFYAQTAPFSVTGAGVNGVVQLLSGSTMFLVVGVNTFTLSPAGTTVLLMTDGSRVLRAGAATVSIVGGIISMTRGCYFEADGVTIGSSVSGICLTMTLGCTFIDSSTSSFTSTGAAAMSLTDSVALVNALTLVGVGGTALTMTNSRFKSSGAVTTTGGLTITQSSSVIFGSTATIGGALSISLGSYFQTVGVASCTTSCVITGASTFVMGAAFTVSTPSSNGISLSNGSSFQQIAGTLTAIATAGDGMSITTESKVALLGGASTILTGVGASTAGLRVRGGSRAWFTAGAPTSVTGPASADLVVGGNAAVANGTLAANNNFITDTDTTGLLGGGNVIGRAA